jgi:hypothetical protein
MMKNLYLTALLTLSIAIGFKASAQTDEAGIKTAVNYLFEGMKKGDTALLRSAFTSQPVMQTIVKNKEGKTEVITEPLDSFIVSVGRPHSVVYDERISFDLIRIDGDLAIVWAPYKFYLGDKFSHCGVDSFQLVKINGEWKIQYIIDTRRKQDCN